MGSRFQNIKTDLSLGAVAHCKLFGLLCSKVNVTIAVKVGDAN